METEQAGIGFRYILACNLDVGDMLRDSPTTGHHTRVVNLKREFIQTGFLFLAPKGRNEFKDAFDSIHPKVYDDCTAGEYWMNGLLK